MRDTKNRSMFELVFGSLSKRMLFFVLLASALFYAAMLASGSAQAQPQDDDMGPVGQKRLDEAFNNNEASGDDAAPTPSPRATNREEIGTQRMIELMFDENSRWLMLPIALFALVSLIFGVERVIAIRRGKILPSELVAALGEASRSSGGLDPRKAYKICQQYASTASNVIRAAMLKVGRPHSEVEHTVKEASEREADKLYANVRPLNLAAGVTPLLGLLGTVFGMIQAFAQTASGAVATNKAEQLAEGIYTALVTTFAGLAVAIPAAVLAHWLEGRIQSNFREIDELLLNMLPQLEQYEGKLRLRRGEAAEETEQTGGSLASKALVGKNGAAHTAAAPERKRD